MEKLKSLFAIYALFILLSLVSGFGTHLMKPEYSGIVTGSLLILSSFVTLLFFLNEATGDN